MVFVLAVMLLLMAIGISSIVAASANAGSGISRQISNQLDIYADSMHRSIMFSLQTSSEDEGKNISSLHTLGGQILGLAYKKTLDASPDSSFTLNITPTLSDSTDLSNSISNVTIKVVPLVNITPATAQQAEVTDEDGNIILTYAPRKPQTAAISAAATVTVTAKQGSETVISIVTYDFYGGLLEDDGTNPNNMIINSAGTWRFNSHEKVDK